MRRMGREWADELSEARPPPGRGTSTAATEARAGGLGVPPPRGCAATRLSGRSGRGRTSIFRMAGIAPRRLDLKAQLGDE